jgi:hypothetical protein
VRRGRKAVAAAAAFSLVVVVLAAPASAWLTATYGAGSSSASVDPTAASTNGLVVADATVGGLYPGRTVVASMVVTNNGPAVAVVRGIAGDPSAAVGPCPAGAVTVTGRLVAAGLVQADGVTTQLAAGGGFGTYSVQVSMSIDAPAGCADASFPLSLSVSGGAAS